MDIASFAAFGPGEVERESSSSSRARVNGPVAGMGAKADVEAETKGEYDEAGDEETRQS